jgi:hypothetical protein
MKRIFEIIMASALILGLIFKLFNWFGWDIFLVFSLGLFIPIYFISEIVSQWKSTSSKFLLFLNSLGLIILSQGFFYKAMHWPGCDIMLILSLCFLWPIYFISKGIIQRKERKGTLLNGMLYSIFPIAILFDLMHWPGVDVVKIFAFGILLIVVASSFLRKENIQLINLNFSANSNRIIALVMFICLFLYSERFISKRVLSTESYTQLELQEKFQLEKELGDRYINEKNKAKANAIDAETVKLIHLIDDVKLDIIKQVGELNPSEIRRFDRDVVLWKKADPEKLELFEINLIPVANKFDFDVPMHMLLGSDIKRLDPSKAGLKIWHSFITYQKSLLKVLEVRDSLSNKEIELAEHQSMEDLLSYWSEKEYVDYFDLNNVHWMGRTFDHSTVLQSIVKLTDMQLEIIRMRNLALSGL